MSGLLNSEFNGSTSDLPDTTGRPFTTSFSAQSGSNATLFNHAGTIKGLDSIHGSFNIPNVTGTLASRNSTMNGGQQPSGSFSNGRFAVNSFPAAFSQLSHASSHGQSGVTNRGGSEVSQILGNMGPRITDSTGNLVGGGNIGRSLSYGGGFTIPGLASRLNLIGNSGAASMSIEGSNRLVGGVLSQAPQVISMQGNSYSAAGGPVTQNLVQAGNNYLTSAAFLNELSAHENAPFDINDFPQLTGRPNSAGSSQGQPGSLRKQSVGVVQQNQEFSIQKIDFPALPGSKGGDSDFSVDLHHKEQLHDNAMSMMQSQHLPMGRSAGYALGGPYSSHHQQPQQHAPSVSGRRVSFLPAKNQDVLHFHGSDSLPSFNASYYSQVQSIRPPTIGLRPINTSNTMLGLGSNDQFGQQYQQLQSQSQFRLQQMSSAGPYRDQDLKSTQASQAVSDRFGMLGLLNVVRKSNPDLTSLALGIDLIALGLDLNSSNDLHKKFASPWSEEPAKGESEYSVPEYYYDRQPPVLNQGYFSQFQLKTLFYIFYSMPKEEAQLYAANELYIRGWLYHRELRLWLIRVANMEPLVKTNTYERASYLCFDPNRWETIRKDNFVLQYGMLEKRPTLLEQ